MSAAATEASLSEEEVWKAHILRARASRLSDVKYCQKHELSVWRFATFKKKLGLTKPKSAISAPKVSAFVKAVSSDSPIQSEPVERKARSLSALPNAQWMAQFVMALLSQKR